MASPQDLVTLSGTGKTEDIIKVLKMRCDMHQNFTWAGDSLVWFGTQKNNNIIFDSFNDNCKAYFIDPEFEQCPPHPYSLGNRLFQNICKGCSKDQTIVLLGSEDLIKRKIASEIRFFLVESSFPKIDQSSLDSIDFLITLLTTSEVPKDKHYTEASLEYSFSFGTVNHNLIELSISIKNLNLTRLVSTEAEDGNFLITNVFLHAIRTKLLTGIFTPYSDKSKYSFTYQPSEPLPQEQDNLFTEYHRRFHNVLIEIGFTRQQTKEIYRVLMSVLLLGNIMFTEKNGNTIIRSPEQLQAVCQMIGCSNPKRLEILLCSNVPPQGAAFRRDHLAQVWYRCVVEHILSKINQYLSSRFGSNSQKTNQRKITILHTPCFDYRMGIPSGALQFQRNYMFEWILNFYYSDMFSQEYKDLQSVQEESVLKSKSPDNSDILNTFLDLDNSQTREGLLNIIEEYSAQDRSSGESIKTLQKRKYSKLTILNGDIIRLAHFSENLSVTYDVREILYTNQCPLEEKDVRELHTHCALQIFSHSNCPSSMFLSYITRFQEDTNHVIRILGNSDHLYCSTLLYDEYDTSKFTQEMSILELQPLIQVHKFGYPLRLQFDQFIECFKSIVEDKKLPNSISDREKCLHILERIPSLKPADYILSDTTVFLKHDKERIMVSALWEKNGRSQRSYSRSRAKTCGELFPRGIGTSSMVEKITATWEEEKPSKKKSLGLSDYRAPSLPSTIFEDLLHRSDSVHFKSSSTLEIEEESVQEKTEPKKIDNLEGRGRALLVMMSCLGQYDRMIPIAQCLRVLFSSPVYSSELSEDYLLQLTQAIESFHFPTYQNEENILNFYQPQNNQVGGVFSEIHRLREMVDEFHKHPDGIIQFHKVTEFVQLSKRRIEDEIYTEPHYKDYNYMIRISKCYALFWKHAEPLETVRQYIIEQGILELLLILLSDSASCFTLKYTISGLMKLLSSHIKVQFWFAQGNGIRSVLQVLSHFYEETTQESISQISEYNEAIGFLFQLLLHLTDNEDFIQSLFQVLRFHRSSDSYNLPVILCKAVQFHNEVNRIRLILKIIEKCARVYGPSNEYLHSGIIQALVQLLDDSRIYYETGCILSILLLPEYLPTIGSIDLCLEGCISMLLKHLILSAPDSGRTIRTHVDSYGFIIAQLVHYSIHCQNELRQVLGDSTLQYMLQEDQDSRVNHLMQLCHQLKNNPVGLQRVLGQCNQRLTSAKLIWTQQ